MTEGKQIAHFYDKSSSIAPHASEAMNERWAQKMTTADITRFCEAAKERKARRERSDILATEGDTVQVYS
jgi:hypothetical protein